MSIFGRNTLIYAKSSSGGTKNYVYCCPCKLISKFSTTTTLTSPESAPAAKAKESRSKKPAAGAGEYQSHSQYCMELVKKQDYENFLCTLLIGQNHVRQGVFAIRAFNTEVSSIRDQITNKNAGIGRLTFWRDSIDRIFKAKIANSSSSVPKQPILFELHNTISRHELSKKWFSNIIDSRERTLEDRPFESLDQLEKYCDMSTTPIFYLTLEMLGIKDVDIDHAASHLGKAIGLVNFIRSLPYNVKKKRVLVPKDLLDKYDLAVMDFIKVNENNQARIQDLIFDIASQSNAHYEKARNLKQSSKKEALAVFLYGIPSGIYLKRLQSKNFNPFTPQLSQRYGFLPIQLYYRKLTNSY